MATTTFTNIPLYTDTSYLYGISIEGSQKQLKFYWNTRASTWHMDILNEDQTPVVVGVPLVALYPILADHPMDDQGLTGYFVLYPSITSETLPDISSDSSVMPEMFLLIYVYVTE